MPSSNFKFGRRPRKFSPRVPHLSALIQKRKSAAPLPVSVDYTKGMPSDFGMFLNDRIGDCVCAGIFHAIEVWSFNASGLEEIEPDSNVEKLYEEACGYNPILGPFFDPGCNEQEVLNYLLSRGAPTGLSGQNRHKIAAFIESDPRNLEDIKRAIFECGIVLIGFPVPSNLDPSSGVWDYDPNAKMTGQGHAVVLAGYNEQGAIAISWGRLYTLTWAFIQSLVDEAYAIADELWITSKGTSPGGLTLEELEVQMQALKLAASEDLFHLFDGGNYEQAF